MVREILVNWTTPAGGGQLSVFHFLEGTAVNLQRAALSTMLNGLDNNMTTSTSWSIATSGRVLDDATGTLTGVWAEGTTYGASGSITGSPVADASQALIRWSTDHIVAGRFLKGRTYLPGVSSASISGGNLLAATQTSFQTYAQGLVTAAVQLAIWHRPKAGAGGVAWAVDSAAVWNEFAVLRRRRG